MNPNTTWLKLRAFALAVVSVVAGTACGFAQPMIARLARQPDGYGRCVAAPGCRGRAGEFLPRVNRAWQSASEALAAVFAAARDLMHICVQVRFWKFCTVLITLLWSSGLSRGQTMGGTVVAWGDDFLGDTAVPPGLADATAVSGGSFLSLALLTNGTVSVWGNLGYGQTPPAGLSNVRAISAGDGFNLAFSDGVGVVAWGGHNNYGETTVPPGLLNCTAVAAGVQHSVALKQDGTVVAWGQNSAGQATVPAGLSNVVAIAAGEAHTLALRTDGTVVGWGGDTFRQIDIPGGFSNVVAIAAGYNHSLALRGDGTVLAWGRSDFGAIAVPAELSNVVAIAGGEEHSLALRGDGTVVGWGYDFYGQCDPPAEATNLVDIAAGVYHSLALRNSAVSFVAHQAVERTVYSGSTVLLAAGALAVPGASCQWQLNGTNISGATGTVLWLANIKPSNAGSYRVVSTNSSGAATSSNLNLTVVTTLPIITCQPTNNTSAPGLPMTFAVSAVGSLPLSYQWLMNGTNIAGATDSALILTNLQLSDEGTYNVVLSNAYGSVTSANAFLDVLDLAETLNTTNLVWTTSGDALWFSQQLETHDGVAAAQSGAINYNSQSVLQTTVSGPGVLTFWWKVESQPGNDHVSFSANGVENVRVSGGPGWQQQSVYIGAGAQALQWVYFETDWVATGQDAGWVDQVNFVPGGTPPFITLNPTNQIVLLGANATLNATALGTPPLRYQWQFNLTNLPGATNVSLALTNAQFADEGSYTLVVSNVFGFTNTTAAYLNVVDFTEALNATNLVWSSAGDAPWYPQTATTHDGVAALRSGAITGNHQSVVQTAVDGPGTLSFWWMVSSETNNDCASFLIDGAEQSRISGTVNWQQRTYYLLPGTHSLTWKYSKNATINSGADAVWLDQVVYTNGGTAPIIAAGPMDQVTLLGSNATFAVTTQGTAPFSFQWLFNGNSIPDATNSTLSLAGVQVTNTGNYQVVLANDYGVTTSSSAKLSLVNVVAWGAGKNNLGFWPDNGQSALATNLVGVKAIAGGGGHSLALQANGRVAAWGLNSSGQTNVPTTLTNAMAVAAGMYYSLALKSNGTVSAWGSGNYSITTVPAAATNVVALTAGWYHSLVLKSNGTIVAWGAGTIQSSSPHFGQSMVPTDLAGVMAVAAGGYHSLALRTNGTVVAWGWNASGQTNVPAGLSNVMAIAAGASNSIALKNDGTVVAWGGNGYGQANIPPGLSNVVAISAGAAHNMALKNDGTLAVWGLNGNSQTNVPLGVSNMVAIAAGAWHSLAIINMGPATFLGPPGNWTIFKGNEVTLTLPFVGVAPMSYQWVHNGTNVVDGTYLSLAITNAQFTDAGIYQLLVSNAYGATTSVSAVLTVNDTAPYFIVQPTDLFVWPKSDATFSTGVGGIPPFYYQWQFNGANLSGATNSALTITNARLANAGSYQVVVDNLYGSTTSTVATLTLPLPPTIIAQPAGQTVWVGSNATFSVTASGTGPFNYQWQLNGSNIVNNIITTVAGNGIAIYAGDGGVATNASLNSPYGVTMDGFGNVYVADTSNHRIRRVDTNGVITTVAGKGTGGYSGDGAAATNASLNNPAGVVLDASGNLYVADRNNSRIRRVGTNGIITTVAGGGSSYGDGGPATNASLNQPYGIALSASGSLYIVDCSAHRVRAVSTNGIITTVAGKGSPGFSGDGGTATSANLNGPTGAALDPMGNLYIADSGNCRIRIVATNGVITTMAGYGIAGYFGDRVAATSALLNNPSCVALDGFRNLYIADSGNNRIREVDTNGIITTVVGVGKAGFSGDGNAATSAGLNLPSGVALDPAGNLYFADRSNQRVRKVAGSPSLTLSNAAVTAIGNYTVVISSAWGSITSSVAGLTLDGPPTIATQPASQTILMGGNAAFQVSVEGTPPFDFAWYSNGTNLIAEGTSASLDLDQVATSDAGPYTVVITNQYGSVTSGIAVLTVALPPSVVVQPAAPQAVLAGDKVILTVAAAGTGPFSYQWRWNGTNLPSNIITTVAGSGGLVGLGDGGLAINASLYSPYDMAFDVFGNMYIADFNNNRVRKVDTNGLIASVGTGFSGPGGLAVDACGNVYVADYFNDQIRKVATNGAVSTVAGSVGYGFSGDGGAATNARLYKPQAVAVDLTGNLFIADDYNHRIRKVDTNGIIMTVAGNGGAGYSGNGGPATNAMLHNPSGVTVDPAGNLYIGDWENSRVQKVDASGIISTVAGGGWGGDGGVATNANLYAPSAVAADALGNLYIADTWHNRIRMVDTNGIITTVAGNGIAGYSGDESAATNASIASPRGIHFDSAGNLYIADKNNNRIREVALAGSPTRALTSVTTSNSGDYNVVVTSPWGSITSSVVTLIVKIRPSIIGTVLNADGSVTLNCSGTPNSTNRVWVASSLAPPVAWWAASTNVAGADGSWQFTDIDTSGYPAHFYRVSMP